MLYSMPLATPVPALRPPRDPLLPATLRGAPVLRVQPHVRGLPQGVVVQLCPLRHCGKAGEPQRNMCAQSQHD